MKNKNLISFLIGLLLIVASIFTFVNPLTTFLMLSYTVGAICIVKGLHLVYVYFTIKNMFKVRANTSLVIAICLIVVGFVFVIKPVFANKVFAYIIAIWFIYDSVNNFINMKVLREFDIKLYTVGIITNIFLLLGAVSIMISPWIAMLTLSTTLGITFLVSGISYIAFSIGRGKEKKNFSYRRLK